MPLCGLPDAFSPRSRSHSDWFGCDVACFTDDRGDWRICPLRKPPLPSFSTQWVTCPLPACVKQVSKKHSKECRIQGSKNEKLQELRILIKLSLSTSFVSGIVSDILEALFLDMARKQQGSGFDLSLTEENTEAPGQSETCRRSHS